MTTPLNRLTSAKLTGDGKALLRERHEVGLIAGDEALVTGAPAVVLHRATVDYLYLLCNCTVDLCK